jgi:hypothetical protein
MVTSGRVGSGNMGKLLYGTPPTEVDFDDRVLVHLQIVIGAKLRRGESFFFSWKNDIQVGDGRSSIWMDAAIPLAFKYSGGRVPIVNREWLDILTASANSGSGLQYIPEPTNGGNEGGDGATTH